MLVKTQQREGSYQPPRDAFATLQKCSQVAGDLGAALPRHHRRSWGEIRINHLLLFHPVWHPLVSCHKAWAPIRHLKLPESLEKPVSSIASLWPLQASPSAPSGQHHGSSLLFSVPAKEASWFPFSMPEISPSWFPLPSFHFPHWLLDVSRLLVTD